jgi:hypothetical protein
MCCGNKRPSRVRNLKDLPFPLGCADQLTCHRSSTNAAVEAHKGGPVCWRCLSGT